MKRVAFIYKYIGGPWRSDFTYDERRHALELEEAHEKIIKALKRKYDVIVSNLSIFNLLLNLLIVINIIDIFLTFIVIKSYNMNALFLNNNPRKKLRPKIL